MPRFFVPESGSVGSEDLYQWIVRYVQAVIDCQVGPARILSLAYTAEGRQWESTVGEPDPRTGQLVMAILRSADYLICTPYYGVRRGQPLRIASSDVTQVRYFDGLENASKHLRQAIDVLDTDSGTLQSRLRSAVVQLGQLSLDDFPPIMAADFLSLQHLLSWRGEYDATIREMPDSEALTAALAMRALYVDVLSSVGLPDA
jgi:hypothetical protein